MGNLALRVEGLGKMYRIGGKQERYATLRDTLTDAVSAPFKRARSLIRGEAYGAAGLKEEIWALKDVSFEVKHGEVVGIIGRNGAGKSTLLKILSRITEPTEGYAEVYGRVGSLLEVGTGFHPELTGRENIYLNGAILGMSREEINRKFDEIVDFAEIEKFIDTPVKHYSSGMGLRLGFAVAAHLEPEILVVDEVLAVGDAQFQQKCLGKMSDVAGEGRTVLFVSHNMGAVQSLCGRGIGLENGSNWLDGDVFEVTQRYMNQIAFDSIRSRNAIGRNILRKGTGKARYVSIHVLDKDKNPTSSILMGDDFSIDLEFTSSETIKTPVFTARLFNDMGQNIVAWRTNETQGAMPPTSQGGHIILRISDLPLLPGSYNIAVSLTDGYQTHDFIEHAVRIEILPNSIYKTGVMPKDNSIIYAPCRWVYDYS